MSDQKSASLFSDQNPLFSNGMLSSSPIDWNNLSNNSTNGLIDICHELHIPIKEPIVKRELINSLTSYLKNNNIPSLSFSPSYNHINSLFQTSPNDQKSIALSRIPESYCQQMPSISSFFGTSSSFQPLAVSPFSQILKKWKQQPNHANSNQATSNQSTNNQKTSQKPINFKPSYQNPNENNAKNYSNKNRNNKFVYTNEDNDSHQQNKVEQFLPSPKNQRQRQNYSKQNQQKQQQKNQVIPEPSQIVVNKNALQNMPQSHEIQTRSIPQPNTIEINQKPQAIESNNSSISSNNKTQKSNFKITNSSNDTNKPNNSNTSNNSNKTPNSQKTINFNPTSISRFSTTTYGAK